MCHVTNDIYIATEVKIIKNNSKQLNIGTSLGNFEKQLNRTVCTVSKPLFIHNK